MELISRIALAAASGIGALCSRQAADEFKAWTPWIVERLLRRAVRGFPEIVRERLIEEWRAHASDIPGEIGKLAFAIGLQVGEEFWKSIAEKALALAFMLAMLPSISFIIIFILVKDGKPVFLIERHEGGTRETRFRSEGAFGRALRRCSLDYLPSLFDILAGRAKLRLWK